VLVVVDSLMTCYANAAGVMASSAVSNVRKADQWRSGMGMAPEVSKMV
jgi:hypothetical protein